MDEKYTELSGRATGAGSTSVLEAAEFAVLDLETTPMSFSFSTTTKWLIPYDRNLK